MPIKNKDWNAENWLSQNARILSFTIHEIIYYSNLDSILL